VAIPDGRGKTRHRKPAIVTARSRDREGMATISLVRRVK